MMIICGKTAAKETPSSMFARRASLTAVSGSTLIKGCTTLGKFEDEKKTPEKIHIGSMMKFMIPETASVVRARDALSNPSPPNEIVRIVRAVDVPVGCWMAGLMKCEIGGEIGAAKPHLGVLHNHGVDFGLGSLLLLRHVKD